MSGAALLEARLGRATSYRPSACFLSSFLEAYCESPNLTSFRLSRSPTKQPRAFGMRGTMSCLKR